MAGEERDLTNRDDSRPVRVKVDNVKKIYNTRNGEMVALNGVTLDIHDNEFICVVGPSGCGKSTLLNIIRADKRSSILQWKRSKRNRYRPWRCIPAVCIIPMAYC